MLVGWSREPRAPKVQRWVEMLRVSGEWLAIAFLIYVVAQVVAMR